MGGEAVNKDDGFLSPVLVAELFEAARGRVELSNGAAAAGFCSDTCEFLIMGVGASAAAAASVVCAGSFFIGVCAVRTVSPPSGLEVSVLDFNLVLLPAEEVFTVTVAAGGGASSCFGADPWLSTELPTSLPPILPRDAPPKSSVEGRPVGTAAVVTLDVMFMEKVNSFEGVNSEGSLTNDPLTARRILCLPSEDHANLGLAEEESRPRISSLLLFFFDNTRNSSLYLGIIKEQCLLLLRSKEQSKMAVRCLFRARKLS